jgi:peptide/nickel transport system ATP-binding protein
VAAPEQTGTSELAENTPALRVGGLTVSYHRGGQFRRVLEEVSLQIMPAEALGLVGETGCGKTTLALALMRYLPPSARVDAGTITVDGRDLRELSGQELRRWRGGTLAMVYQDPASALNPVMRVGEQIAEAVHFHDRMSWRSSHQRATEMLEKVALPDPGRFARRYPHQLSGGQQQRVVIAMALACRPRLLILDEPTTGLDATIEAQVLELIAGLREEFRTAILFISHNLALISRVCDRVAVLYAGRIVETGATDDVLRVPRHPYSLGLLGCVPRHGATKAEHRLQPIAGELPSADTELPGCRFAPRCQLAEPRCSEAEPGLVPLPGGPRADHLARCYRAVEAPRLARLMFAGADKGSAASAGRAGTALIEVEGLTTAYRSVVACDQVSLTIREGEVLGLVGESGSGKTTLALTLAGLVPVRSGVLRYRGEILPATVRQRPLPTLRDIQMVFQNPETTLNPRHRVRYILGRAIKRLGGTGSAEDLAAMVRLRREQLAAMARQLSGGERQRVAIARAFAGHPGLVICDEPVSSLDVSVQAVILNLLSDLQAVERTAYLFVSHDLAVVRYLADRIGVMYAGQLIELGPAEELFAPPHHPYTAALLAAAPGLDPSATVRRVRLAGEVPSLAAPPSGCRFHTRCPWKIGEICQTDPPPWRQAGPGHRIRCHHPVDGLTRLEAGVAGTVKEATGG